MATITLDASSSADGNAVITGTTDAADNEVAVVEIRPDGGSAVGDMYQGKVAGGRFHIPTNPSGYEMAPKVLCASSQAVDTSAYIYDPNIYKLQADNTYLLLYWRGYGHVDDAGAIYGKISTDNQQTFGAEFLVADTGLGTYDTRNIAGGVNPTTGEIILFYRVYSAFTTSNIDTMKVIGSADASTWGTPVSVSSWAGVRSPFGNIIWGTNGAFVVFRLGSVGSAWIIKSTDGFDTVTVTEITGADEAWIVPIDDNRAVFVTRDNTDGNRNSYRYCKTSDWGANWSALSSPYPLRSRTIRRILGMAF